MLVTLVGAMDTLGDGVAIQRVSWRRPRAIDFRSIRGAMSADGLGNLLSGLAGTLPNTTYATGISIVELTGVAARSVGACIGLIFVVIAFVPKMAPLGERAAGGLMEQEVSLRLLRHYASSVRHNQYHETDVITVRVESAHAL